MLQVRVILPVSTQRTISVTAAAPEHFTEPFTSPDEQMSAARYSGARLANFRRKIYIRDKGICQLCNQPVSFEEFTLDHKLPKSKGGGRSYNNLQAAHYECNQQKADQLTFSIKIMLVEVNGRYTNQC